MKKTTSNNTTIHSRVKEELLNSIRFKHMQAKLPAGRRRGEQFGLSR